MFLNKAQSKDILKNLVSFLGVKDSLSLMRASKVLYAERNTFMKHLKTLKLTIGLSPKQRKHYWLAASKAKSLKDLYGEHYFSSLLIKTCPCEMEIKKDIDRTFLHVKQFKMQNGYIIPKFR